MDRALPKIRHAATATTVATVQPEPFLLARRPEWQLPRQHVARNSKTAAPAFPVCPQWNSKTPKYFAVVLVEAARAMATTQRREWRRCPRKTVATARQTARSTQWPTQGCGANRALS